MDEKRLERVWGHMEALGLEQIIVTDPASVFYLTGKWIHPGERMLALYLSRQQGRSRFVYNELFTVPEELGVEKVSFSDVEDGAAVLAGLVDSGRPLGIDKAWPARFLLRLMELNPGGTYLNASACVDYARAVKDLSEQERMRQASKVNDLCMAQFASGLREGMTELELAARFWPIYRDHGASAFSFDPLVSFGATAAVGHHAPDETALKEGDCVLIDVGCVVDDYCSDMTRTFFYRSVTPQQRHVYDIVRWANEAAEEMIRPGVRFCDLDRKAREIIENAGYGPYFTHRLGHSIGIECHECDDVSAANERILEPGMIFSIEPGIYLPGELGVRIEDLVLVTEEGCEVLNGFTKELTVLE